MADSLDFNIDSTTVTVPQAVLDKYNCENVKQLVDKIEQEADCGTRKFARGYKSGGSGDSE